MSLHLSTQNDEGSALFESCNTEGTHGQLNRLSGDHLSLINPLFSPSLESVPETKSGKFLLLSSKWVNFLTPDNERGESFGNRKAVFIRKQ